MIARDEVAATIRRALEVVAEPGDVNEIRIPKAGRQRTISGYFDDIDAMAQATAEVDGQFPGVYATLNPVNPALLARAANKVRSYAEATTSDADVLRRRWLLVDADPVRPAGVSSSQEEHAAAIERIRQVYPWLQARGFQGMVVADSGNGAHLLVRIDLPNDAESLALVNRCLAALDLLFSDAAVNIDVTVGNAARISKLYGTLVCKGENLEARPHRRSRLLFVPENRPAAAREMLESLAALAPEPRHSNERTLGSFDLERWIANHAGALPILRTGPWNGGTKWVLKTCPFNPEHTDASSTLR